MISAIEKNGVVKKIFAPFTDSLKKWLDARTELDGVKFTASAAAKFLENINLDMNRLRTEYEKLITFISLEKEKIINEKMVDRLVNRVYDLKIFDLVDYIGARDKENALKALGAVMKEKQSMIGIITLIHRMFKVFLYFKCSPQETGRPLPESPGTGSLDLEDQGGKVKKYISRNIGHSPYLVNRITSNYLRFSKNYNAAEIRGVFDILNKYDIALRSGDTQESILLTKLIIDIVK